MLESKGAKEQYSVAIANRIYDKVTTERERRLEKVNKKWDIVLEKDMSEHEAVKNHIMEISG